MIITIDGPAGSGKSSAASLLADRLGITYLDTGAMYRCVTLAALEQAVNLDDQQALANLARTLDIQIIRKASQNQVLLNNRDVTREIRKPEITNASHKIAGAAPVRAELVAKQQAIGQSAGSLVTEGRDQGTVVFPQADFKFYLVASPECRARRRFRELQEKGIPANFEDILQAQIQRDQRDASREVGPLKPSEDATVMDTTNETLSEVVDMLYNMVKEESR